MTLHTGDCLDVMASFEAGSIDAIVTDPPYGLGFMGKAWDHGAPGIPFWAAMLRVAKPSAYLLAFGGTRTVHRMACAIEDAGWVIRDMLVWAYASGFPKSRASLKPAWEPIVMARKPGPLRSLDIDSCRIGYAGPDDFAATVAEQSGPRSWKKVKTATTSLDFEPTGEVSANPSGRWPANVILTDPIFDGGVEGVVRGGSASDGGPPTDLRGLGGIWHEGNGVPAGPQYGDSGTYSRFFLIPKADRADREPVLGGLPLRAFGQSGGAQAAIARGEEYQQADASTGLNRVKQRSNVHPTVKPVDLMRHLVRLVTPSGGVVLDPFLGSGTTALAAEMEGFEWIGIEREAEYMAIAEARLNGTQRGMAL